MTITRLLLFSSILGVVFGDPTDWVSVSYVVSKNQNSGRDSTTSEAEKTMLLLAHKYANGGPFSIVDAEGILPPNGNSHDYLSWAPYHWPVCNWCPGGKTHLAHTVDSKDKHEASPSSTDVSFFSYSLDDPYQYFARLDRSESILKRQYNSPAILNTPPGIAGHIPTPVPSIPLPSTVVSVPEGKTQSPTSSSTTTVGPAQAAAKTTKSTCTPSPTQSIPPSATWTLCPYVGRDGQVNPDVRTLHGPATLNTFSQAVICIAVGFALQDEPSLSEKFASFMETLFVNETTKMNPNVAFGQMVRGPGGSDGLGSFTGLLDLRGLVKVVNAVMIMESKQSPHWTSDLASAMTSWAGEYLQWLSSSKIAHFAATRPNNHGTFFVLQEASLLLLKDHALAIEALSSYFSHQFLDQIASTGEQPFEAIRSRPYHYRAFNLEAMIANAKLGDQLGVNFWTAKSNHGATIQTALDFAMSQDPRGEDVSDILPHVAAIAAAYGDPTGKYLAFLKQRDPNYKTKSYWFYGQPSALQNAPTSRSKRSVTWKREDAFDSASVPDPAPFVCPAIFDNSKEVEIDNGIFVTCDQLKPFYLSSLAPLHM